MMRQKYSLIDALPQLAVFAKTVECGSFRKAAKELQLSPSVVSYHVSQLELRLNTALLYRTTRHLSLTNEGEMIYESAKQILIEAQNSFDALSESTNTKKGKLTVTLPALMVHHPLFKKLTQFCCENPLVTLNIKVTDQRINLIEQGIDLAIRIGTLEESQASLKQKKLTQIKRILVVGKRLYQSQTMPLSPEELECWPWIGLTMLPYYRTMIHPGGKKVKIKFQPTVYVDNVDAMTECVKHNIGIATPPDYLIQEAINSGEVIHLLPSWEIEPINVYAVWPIHTRKTSLSYYFMQFLQNEILKLT